MSMHCPRSAAIQINDPSSAPLAARLFAVGDHQSLGIAAVVGVPGTASPTPHPLELFLSVLFARADAAIDPLVRASWEDHAYAVERLIDRDNGIPWRRS